MKLESFTLDSSMDLETKTTKIINENLLKLDEIQNLASATSKMTS